MTGSFLLRPTAATVWCDAKDAGGEYWEHRLTGTAVPLLLAERGDCAIHAAAIAVDGRAVVFAGPSGRGKSTLACAAATLGHRVLTEEGAVLTIEGREALAWPGPRAVRVRRDVSRSMGLPPPPSSNGRKPTHLLDGRAHAADPAPLAALVLLGERGPGGPALEPLAAVEAVPHLLPNLMWGGAERLGSAFAAATALAQACPVFACRMPDDLRAAPGALAEVLGAY